MLLTPIRIIKNDIFGALYDEEYRIILESLRYSTQFIHRDHCYLSKKEVSKIENLPKDTFYLGHAFDYKHYGHFLLETLPMLNHFICSQNTNGIFLPWCPRKETIVLKKFMDILGINSNRLIIWRKNKIASNISGYIPRPIKISKTILEKKPYQNVLSKISSLISEDISNSVDKVFLSREPNRISKDKKESVESIFRSYGFSIIKPEKLSITNQIKLIKSAKVIAGFKGSQLHNSIFCKEGSIVISIGDEKNPNAPNTNQKMCDSLVGANSLFVPHIESEEETLDHLTDIFRKNNI